MLTLIDTHCHLDGFHARGELPGVVARAEVAGVTQMIAIGTGVKDWAIHAQLAADYPGKIFHTVGIHPCHVEAGWETEFSQIAGFFERAPRPVAIGETGLDRFHLPKNDAAKAEEVFALQKASFSAHLELARSLKTPLVIHSRNAFAECVAMIDAARIDWQRIVFHCFSESAAEMSVLKQRGGRGSFTGIITYKNAESVRGAFLEQGLEKLMLETDAPYLAPTPHRGKMNEPGFMHLTAEAAAIQLGISLEEVAKKSTENAVDFFGLKRTLSFSGPVASP